MAGRQRAAAHQTLDGWREFGKAHHIGDMAAAFADDLGELGLRIAELLHQLFISGRFFEGIEIRPLHILDDREFQRLLVTHIEHNHRQFMQPGPLGRAPATFPGDDLENIRYARFGPHHERLDNPFLPDRIRELREILISENLARVERVGAYELDRHAALAASALLHDSLVRSISDQGGKSSSKSRWPARRNLINHRVFPLAAQAAVLSCRSRWITSEASFR